MSRQNYIVTPKIASTRVPHPVPFASTEFAEARNWIATEFSMKSPFDTNLFETTIRVLGGLLGVFHLSHDVIFAEKAVSGACFQV